jgi:glyoxylase-like metal-dependent hydrolase (beta-lactamase superfamily II)/rhodanese-related sulfurtransferase
MKIQQLYTPCLSEAAYLIESNGEAAIIDPLREVAPYLEWLAKEGATLKYVFETHFHADFVSGHLDLSKATGAPIVYGPGATANFQFHEGKHGERFQLGDCEIVLLHTPGHTMESSCFLLLDKSGKEQALFSGDTLFIGDVGRPDLAVKSDITKEDLAGMLYDSLHESILTLPDHVVVYPGHGAGSACGKKMSKETSDTLGHQKEVNYALQPMTRQEFIDQVTEGLVRPPQYFPKNARMNKLGYDSINEVLKRGTRALSARDFNDLRKQEQSLVLDTRKPKDFLDGHIPDALYIGLDGTFAPWVGALIQDLNTPILIVTEKGRQQEVVTRLARVGYDNAMGFLQGGMDSWMMEGLPVRSVMSIEAEEYAQLKNEPTLVDVRKKSEFDAEHLVGAINKPLDFLQEEWSSLPDSALYIHCLSGYRSVIAISILLRRGLTELINIEGGFEALKKTGLNRSEYVCPQTQL